MKKCKRIVSLLIVVSWQPVIAGQAGVFTQPLPDFETFECKYCPEPAEPQKTLDVGIGFNTSENAKANEFNGRDGNHVIPQANARYSSLTDEGDYLTLWTNDLGNSSREIAGTFGDLTQIAGFNERADGFAFLFHIQLFTVLSFKCSSSLSAA